MTDHQNDSVRDLKKSVREKYSDLARRVASGSASCCGADPMPSLDETDPISADLYEEGQRRELPQAAVAGSLGCGNPTALAQLRAGEVVLIWKWWWYRYCSRRDTLAVKRT